MLTTDAQGNLVELQVFQSACVELFRVMNAVSMFTRPFPDAPPGCTVVFVAFEKRYETAAGRSPDEAFLRMVERLVEGGKCGDCQRVTTFDTLVDRPITPKARPYLNRIIDKMSGNPCTLYFDLRDGQFKKSCQVYQTEVVGPVKP